MSEDRDIDLEILRRRKLLELMRGKRRETEAPLIVEVKSLREFEEWVTRAGREGKAVFVDFWAPWCAPCLMMAPAYERVAEKFRGRAYFLKVNVDELPELASRFVVFSIPTILAMCGGREVSSLVGYRPALMIESWVSKVVSSCQG